MAGRVLFQMALVIDTALKPGGEQCQEVSRIEPEDGTETHWGV